MKTPDYNQPIEVAVEDLHVARLYFNWGQNTIGFGQCSLYRNEDGTIAAHTEGMNKEWLRRALYAVVDTLVDNATVD